MDKLGFIYILTNPSFPQYVKIGYATDVKQRLAELNRSTAVPFAFRVYATYEVDSALSDKKLHAILDKLNPDLRSTEEVDGKKRVREFYAMPPEDVYVEEMQLPALPTRELGQTAHWEMAAREPFGGAPLFTSFTLPTILAQTGLWLQSTRFLPAVSKIALPCAGAEAHSQFVPERTILE